MTSALLVRRLAALTMCTRPTLLLPGNTIKPLRLSWRDVYQFRVSPRGLKMILILRGGLGRNKRKVLHLLDGTRWVAPEPESWRVCSRRKNKQTKERKRRWRKRESDGRRWGSRAADWTWSEPERYSSETRTTSEPFPSSRGPLRYSLFIFLFLSHLLLLFFFYSSLIHVSVMSLFQIVPSHPATYRTPAAS